MSRKRENTNTAFRTIDQLITAGDSFPCGVTLRNTVLEFAEKMSALGARTHEMYRLRYRNRTVDSGHPLWGVDCSDYLNDSEWFVSPDGYLYYHTDEHCSLDEKQRELKLEFCECECERTDCDNCSLDEAHYYNLVRVDTWEAIEAAAQELSLRSEDYLLLAADNDLYRMVTNEMTELLERAAREYYWDNCRNVAGQFKKSARRVSQIETPETIERLLPKQVA